MNENMYAGGGQSVTQNTLDIRVRVYPVRNQEEPSSLRAIADVTLGGCFGVRGIRVMDGDTGLFVSMPRRKDKEGQYRDICFPTTAQMRKELHSAVLGEYQRVMDQPQMEAGQPQNAAGQGRNAAKKRQGTAR